MQIFSCVLCFFYVQAFAASHVLSPVTQPKFLIQKINQNSVYKKKFEELYKNGVSFENIVDALVNFEKALVTPNAKFDKFISGDESVFDDEEKHGFELFKKIGCINCHSGANMGANLYYELRFHADGNKAGRYKVPSLRNIEKTAPYFYSGEVMDLKDTIKAVGKILLNYDLSDEQTHELYKFLLTLSGEKPEILK